MLRLSKALFLAVVIALAPLHAMGLNVCDSETVQHSQGEHAPFPSGGEHDAHCNLCVAHCAVISGSKDPGVRAEPEAWRIMTPAEAPPAFISDTLDRPPLALRR